MLAGDADGWRLGWGVLVTKGMASWMGAWPTAGDTADRYGMAAANSQALPLSTTQKGGEPCTACSSLLPAATADIVAVLAAMTLAHAS
ncbi:MAG: hypothetical protein GEU86_04365 [Actinophytocola sp.]|nr:hypothetical protein [Actinophytocola sp.]